MITSPGLSPAVAAGPPERTVPISAPCLTGVADGDAEVGVLDGLARDQRVDDGLDGAGGDGEPDAGVDAADVWPSTAICTFVPITLPVASISGPPELPWLIGASVWIVFEIE